MFKRIAVEFAFIKSLIAMNLSSAMEYRVAFISQIFGMFINNGIYFAFWLIFFEKFGQVGGYQINDIYLLFAVITASFGLATTFGGNIYWHLATLISGGKLDYYLVLPRPLLTHVIFSRMSITAVGDLLFGIMAFFLAGHLTALDIFLFGFTTLMAAIIIGAYGVIAGSLAFFMGNAQQASQQMMSGILVFGMYPSGLFTGFARLLLLTLIPATFIGSVPVSVISNHNFMQLGVLVGVTALFMLLAVVVFAVGLRRYESGSALNVNV